MNAASERQTNANEKTAAPERSIGQSDILRSISVTRTSKPERLPSAAGVPYSSMAEAKTSNKLAASPGVANGSVIRKNERQGEAPKTRPTSE